jgi:hypothetical protein
MDHIIALPLPTAKLSRLVITDSLHNFFSGIHHKGAVLKHWFTKRFSFENEKFFTRWFCLKAFSTLRKTLPSWRRWLN